MKPFPTPAAVDLILDGGVVGTRVNTHAAATALPAARVELIRDAAPLQPWAEAIFQVSLWADTEAAAGDIAYRLAAAWDRATPDTVKHGLRRHSTWISSSPRSIPDPDTGAARFIMELGLVVSEETPS